MAFSKYVIISWRDLKARGYIRNDCSSYFAGLSIQKYNKACGMENMYEI